MSPNEYQKLAARTLLSNNEHAIRIANLVQKNSKLATILVAAAKIASESGELNDALIKHIMYGQGLDILNIIEECGDILWYVCQILTAVGHPLEYCMQQNIEKLEKRYPSGKFTEQDATERKDKQ